MTRVLDRRSEDATTPRPASRARAGRGFGLVRGERWIASIGLAMAGLLAVTAMLGGAWGWWTGDRNEEASHAERIESIGQMLADAAASLAAAGDMAGLRQLAGVRALEAGLDDVCVRLGDGTIIAASDAMRIQAMEAPESWPALSPMLLGAASERPRRAGVLHATFVAQAAGLGPVAVEIRDARPLGTAGSSLAAGFLGAVGVSLLGTLWVYRGARRRLRCLVALREALLAAQAGETDRAALELGPSLGPEAAAWNALLAQREQAAAAPAGSCEPGASRGAEMATGDFRPVCDAIWLGLMVADDSGMVLYANGAAGILLGKPREALVCAALSEVIDNAEVARAVAAAAAGESRQRVSVEIRRGDGAGVLRVTVRALRKGDTPSAVLLIEDVTQQRIASEARDGFVAQAAHELRTPLTNIRLYAEEAIEFGETDQAVRTRALNVINTEARRLERIVGNMLSVSEIEAGAPRLSMAEVRLETMVAELEDDFRALAEEKQIGLSFDLPPKYPVVFADRDKLMLALHNLVGNALKYTPAGGKVVVRLDADEHQITVDVADSGIGIAPEEHERIFDRFYRAQDSRIGTVQGTGLGLALARQVARLHGGDITLTSEVDKGSTFTITVPTHAKAA